MPSVSSNEKTSNTLDLDATRRLSATPTARHFRADGGGGQGHTTVLQPSMPHTERQAHTWPLRERGESGPRTQLDRAKLLGNALGPFPSETVKPTALGCSKMLRKP